MEWFKEDLKEVRSLVIQEGHTQDYVEHSATVVQLPLSTADAPPPAVSFLKTIAVPLSVLADARGLKGDAAAKAMRLRHRQKKM